MEDERGILISMVPEIFLPTTVLQGVDDIEENIFTAIDSILESRSSFDTAAIESNKSAILNNFSRFSPAIITLAGFSDGINPCAFTALIFFLGFLTLYSYSKKKILVSGISFMVAIFLTYLLLGMGGAALIGKIEKFGLLSKALKYAIGSLAFILGLFALYDYIVYKKTKKSEGLKLQLPAFIKNIMYKHIGSTYRKRKEVTFSTFKLALVTFVSGILISFLESVCTGQIYLPIITIVMRSPGLRMHAFLYLLLYNIAFMVPLIIIFILAYKGIASERFSIFTKQHLGKIKIAYTVLFFILAIFIILS